MIKTKRETKDFKMGITVLGRSPEEEHVSRQWETP